MDLLPILYQDEHLVVINKPSGLLVHPSEMDRYETQNAMKILRDQLGQWVYPIHRLDKPTSGTLLFSLSKESAQILSAHFFENRVSKSYLAIVRGFTKEQEQIDYPLKELWDKMTDQKASREKPPQEAITYYERLAKIELPYPVGRYATARYSLLKIRPLTGRHRQIRRHLKHIFHPIVGDTSFGDGKQNEFFREKFQCHRLLLHAYTLVFMHPFSEKTISLSAPLDALFASIVNALQFQSALNLEEELRKN